MGASESVQITDEDDDEEETQHPHQHQTHNNNINNNMMKKVIEQEPELLPCHASASPLSPQPSAFGTPRMPPSIKVWDPCNVLSPPVLCDDVEVYLVCEGECDVGMRLDLVGGRCPEAGLTANGMRQARALAVFLKSQGVRFNAVYCSPLDRARSTAGIVCQEMDFSEQLIQSSDALQEMSHGLWEGCLRSDIYTPETLTLTEKLQPDFCPPSGESLRQVSFRMLEFLNNTLVSFPHKLQSGFSPTIDSHPSWDILQKPRPIFARRKSGKSRLQTVTTTLDHEADDEMSPRDPPSHMLNGRTTSSSHGSVASSCVGVFSHSVPIRCLLTGVLGCSPVMVNKMCIEDSSVTVLQHSWKTGWQIKRLNDTSHLRLM
ncbi:uncharacterized protein LOC143537179 [Bidens hawaiensis]|uniref:uncharacterized protein LOC143537179 n=1 Tax=Bidens hawaiensis TaxID=980011 RepID=UPI00404AE96E